MAKRTATRELNDRNWDEEEEAEEAGTFSAASEEVIKQRQIIKAKRRMPSTEGSGTKPAFSGFGGFAFKPTHTSTPQTGFQFKPTFMKGKDSEDKQASPGKRSKGDSTPATDQNGSATTEKSTYLRNLKALNESVTNWIQQHVQKNPYCILTPIFKDYEKHIEELEKDRAVESNGNATSSALKRDETMAVEEEKTEKEDKPELPKTGLTFGMGQLKAASTTSSSLFSGFNFKPTSSEGASTSGFSFAVGKQEPKSQMETIKEGEEEEYVPPKVESVEVSEEGSVYSKKCKLFYQKDGTWVERGVGFLHLKEIEDKTQLLVRADTNLGNILLNIMLTSAIPVQKQGKNNVSIVCVPNPPINPNSKTEDSNKPVPMLLRVKTAIDAEEVVQKLNDMKK